MSVQQSGDFELRASGGPAFAGAITLYATGGLGFEFRVDHADVTIDTQGGSFAVRVGLPAPFDPVVANLNLTRGHRRPEGADAALVQPEAAHRRQGAVHGLAAAPASSATSRWTSRQSVGLGVIGFDFVQGTARRSRRSACGRPRPGRRAAPGAATSGSGSQIPIGEHGAFLIEGRGFYFPKRTVEWAPVVDRPLSTIEQLLLQRLLERLPPVEFEPWWVQTTIGFAVRF